MMGVVVLWLASLMIVVLMDAAVSARMSLLMVRRYERHAAADLAARSAAEYAAMLLQQDSDRAVDHPGDGWAVATLPKGIGYGGIWPEGASLRITDLERHPNPGLFPGNRGRGPPDGGVGARWMNVLTACEEAWVVAGFSPEAARALRVRTDEGIREVRDLSSAPGLTGIDLQRLTLLSDQGLLAMRSEVFRVEYCETRPTHRENRRRGGGESSTHGMSQAGCCEIILRREPSRGGIALIAAQMISDAS
ncbi:hypothetical protein JXA88_08565 [Candidatus Fermentibacteria bacterium]|nr:hypothetical protein [Candidatus Fermentibacteria bacterium]